MVNPGDIAEAERYGYPSLKSQLAEDEKVGCRTCDAEICEEQRRTCDKCKRDGCVCCMHNVGWDGWICNADEECEE